MNVTAVGVNLKLSPCLVIFTESSAKNWHISSRLPFTLSSSPNTRALKKTEPFNCNSSAMHLSSCG